MHREIDASRQCDPTPVAESPSFREVMRLAACYAADSAPIVVSGETGSGKDVVAGAIHALSRRTGRFEVVNCAGIAETLLESELFGHVAGAFTGATRDHLGRLMLAHEGTLFLNEIGEMSPRVQAALLCFLDSSLVMPVGGNAARVANVRIVVATNRDLESMVEHGTFRSDLFGRLNYLRIHLLPLRERPEDVGALAMLFAKRRGVEPTPDAIRYLQTLPLPRNARDLDALIVRATVAGARVLDADAFRRVADPVRPVAVTAAAGKMPEGLSMPEKLRLIRESLIKEALEKKNGNIAAAARLLGITSQALSEAVRKPGFHSRDGGRSDWQEDRRA